MVVTQNFFNCAVEQCRVGHKVAPLLRMFQQNIEPARNEPLRRGARRRINRADGRRHFRFVQPFAFFFRADKARDEIVLRVGAAFGNQVFDVTPDPLGRCHAFRPAFFIALGLHQARAFLKGRTEQFARIGRNTDDLARHNDRHMKSKIMHQIERTFGGCSIEQPVHHLNNARAAFLDRAARESAMHQRADARVVGCIHLVERSVGIARQIPKPVARPMHRILGAQTVEHINRRILEIIIIEVRLKRIVRKRRCHRHPQSIFLLGPVKHGALRVTTAQAVQTLWCPAAK